MTYAKRNFLCLEIGEIMRSSLFILPVFVLFFKEQLNLDFSDFMLTEMFFAVIVIALEVPSGYLSDVWRRKIVLFLSFVFYFLGFTILYFADDLWMALAFQACLGISMSLMSGTNSALLYDTLLEEGKTDDYARLEGKRRALGLYTVAACSLVGGFLYFQNPYFPIYASLICAVIGMIACAVIHEPKRVKKTVEKNPFFDAFSTMKYALHGHKVVGLIIIFAAALFASTKLIMWAQQPYYVALGIPDYAFGILLAAGFFVGGFASHINHIIGKHLSNLGTLAVAWALAIAICLGAGFTLSYVGVGLLMFGGAFLFGAAMPRIQDAINKRVESDRRATILSTMSLLQELLYAPLCLIIGELVTQGSIQYGLYGIAAWLGIAGLMLAFWAFDRNKDHLKEMNN